jgi:hypothetical protein
MTRTIVFLLFLSPGFIACNNSGQTAVKRTAVSQHTEAFNASVRTAMKEYYALTEAFVNWDSASAAKEAGQLKTGLDSIELGELKPEMHKAVAQSLEAAKKQLDVMALNNSLTEKRHALNALTQSLFDALRTAGYDEKKIFLQQCPMAFNDEDPGVWLSAADSIRNPYMGLHHPRYGKAMIECGENKSTIGSMSEQ